MTDATVSPTLRNITPVNETPDGYTFAAIRADGKAVTICIPKKEGA